jgi:hypothetical protein
MEVERIAVSTLVKTGAKVAAAVVGASAFLALPVAFFVASLCLPVVAWYLSELFNRLESQADLGTLGSITLACVGSLVISLVILITVVAGLYPKNVPTHTAELLLEHPLVSCACWSVAGIFLFRKLKSRSMIPADR